MSRLDGEIIRGALGNCTIGREIVVLEETTSTNDAILERAVSNRTVGEADSFPPPEGLVIFAEYQTAGRGQRSNRWESARGKGLWFSILLRPQIKVSESARLTQWAAETVAQTISELSITATLKRPNDIQIDGRKAAGVLVEMRAQPGAPHFAIAGIGINVNHEPEDFSDELRPTATSLALTTGKEVDRNQFASSLLRNLDRSYRKMFG